MEQYQEQILLCQAIQKLDKQLAKMNVEPFELNVCGGFALLLQKVRKNGNMYTDVDFIGNDLPKDIMKIVKQVGNELGLGSYWINNDVLLSGGSLEEMEYTTGKLHFEPKMQLSVIKVNALNKKDLLRMKVIAIDTSLCGLSFGGEFTRMKDFEDIRLLAEDLGMSDFDIATECENYVMQQEVFDLIACYQEHPDPLLCVNKTYDEILDIADKYLDMKFSKEVS